MVIFTCTILKIAGGNKTALISNCPNKLKKYLSRKLLKIVEQVGFIEIKKNKPLLEMMGGKLCINATLALAYKLNNKGTLFTTGIIKPIAYENKTIKTKINLSLSYKISKNIVLFKNIGYICIKKNNKIIMNKQLLVDLSNKFNLPAFGAIFYNNNKIVPYIYVRLTNSFVKETACGSGSIAYSLYSGNNNVMQPTEESINISFKDNITEVTAQVNKETLLNRQNLIKLGIIKK